MNSGGGGMIRSASPFTVSQWQELEHQALIFKYIIAGMPVPPDLVLPIQKSFENISQRFFHHPSLNYCSLYGKKVDPEPGRCRRTDGKKWRCSKEAYPDSKYCERHMHRGRSRSRKPVESQHQQQTSTTTTRSSYSSSSPSSTVTSPSFPVSGSTAAAFQNFPLHTFGNMQIAAANNSHLRYNNVESIPFGIPSKDYRYVQGLKPELGERSFFNDESESNRNNNPDTKMALDNGWPMAQPKVSSFPTTKSSFQNDYPTSSFFNIDFASGEASRQDSGQPLRLFFDEWPKTRGGGDSWSGFEDERSNQTSSLSTTQLSISIPMATSDFSATSSRSPHG